ncbi:hypothetical protein Q0Z83_008890 [Actinoplanes sichuanensis]|nr:hypothetical protein Q0Z83_008890 [Actinoplanes sichuanensis]
MAILEAGGGWLKPAQRRVFDLGELGGHEGEQVRWCAADRSPAGVSALWVPKSLETVGIQLHCSRNDEVYRGSGHVAGPDPSAARQHPSNPSWGSTAALR